MISMMVWNWIYYNYYCHNHHHHNCHHYGIWIFKIIIIWTKKNRHHRYSSSDELWFLSSLLDESKTKQEKKDYWLSPSIQIFFSKFFWTKVTNQPTIHSCGRKLWFLFGLEFFFIEKKSKFNWLVYACVCVWSNVNTLTLKTHHQKKTSSHWESNSLFVNKKKISSMKKNRKKRNTQIDK